METSVEAHKSGAYADAILALNTPLEKKTDQKGPKIGISPSFAKVGNPSTLLYQTQ